jgi:hypothetical protein
MDLLSDRTHLTGIIFYLGENQFDPLIGSDINAGTGKQLYAVDNLSP